MGLLAGLTFALVALVAITKIELLWIVVVAVPAGLAGWYLYATRPPSETAAPKPRPDEEPFDDPVEAADREAAARAEEQAREDDELERMANDPPNDADDLPS